MTVLMSAGSLLSLFILQTVLGFVSWECKPDVVTRLIQAYSTAFHGAATWSLNCGELKNLEVSLNKIIQLIWRLPYNLHVSRAGANYFRLVLPLHALSVNKLGGSGGMLPQEN